MGLVDTTGIYSRRLLPVDDGSLAVGGVRLGTLGWWLTSGAVEVGDAQPATSWTDVPGSYGSADQTLTDEMGLAYLGRRTITCHLRTVGSERDASDSMAALAAYNGAETSLTWRELPGRFVGRASVQGHVDTWRGGRYSHTECDLVLDAQPLLVGAKKTVGDATEAFHLTGNRPARPTITVSPEAGAAFVRVTGGLGFVRVDAATSSGFSAGSEVVIDCGDRRCTIGGNQVAPTLDSTYFPLLPGWTSIKAEGADSCSVAIEPLWAI